MTHPPLSPADLRDMRRIFDAVQTFQDNQIHCRSMAPDVIALRAPNNHGAVTILEAVLGPGNATNPNVRKLLASMHVHVVAGAKSQLLIHEGAPDPNHLPVRR